MNPNDKRRDHLILIRTRDNLRIGSLVKQVMANHKTADLLAKWRNANREYFFDSRPVTVDGTLTWMERTINDPSKSLFIILEDTYYQPVGTYNYTIVDEKTVRLDNLIRGEKGGHKALIYGVEVALLGYLFYELGATRVITETLVNNTRVNRLLESVGFTIQETLSYPMQHYAWQNTLPQYQAATKTTPEDRYIRIPEWAK